MFMQYQGGGVGHLNTHYLNRKLKDLSPDPSDEQEDNSDAEIAGLYNNPDNNLHEKPDDGIEDDAEA
jgi:hypothetical protein